jgi:hypothetical protein
VSAGRDRAGHKIHYMNLTFLQARKSKSDDLSPATLRITFVSDRNLANCVLNPTNCLMHSRCSRHERAEEGELLWGMTRVVCGNHRNMPHTFHGSAEKKFPRFTLSCRDRDVFMLMIRSVYVRAIEKVENSYLSVRVIVFPHDVRKVQWQKNQRVAQRQ